MPWTPEQAARRRAKRALDPDYRKRSARKGRPSSEAAAAPRSIEVLTAETRAKSQAARYGSEVKTLAQKVVGFKDALEFLHAAPTHPPRIETPRSRPKTDTSKRVATPCFMVSDLHFGERVTLAESLGVNEYDLAVAAKRMAKCWDNMLWLRKDMARTQTCDDTFLAINGDVVSGDIHDELRETNAGGLRTQCDAALEALAPGVIAMADATPGVLHLVCIGGNHGRLTHRQHIKNGTQHSIEHIGIYGPLRRMIGDRGGKIAWHIPEAERHIMRIHDRRVSTQHGTMIKSQGGIGGTLVPMTRWVTRAADADLYIFGHFHEADAYGKIIKNGSLIGESGYGKWLGVENRLPEQVGWAFDAHRGVRRFERVSVS